jgi:hypothetical protein
MSYRKGFQRLYAVLSLAWIGTCLLLLWPRGERGTASGEITPCIVPCSGFIRVSPYLLWDRDLRLTFDPSSQEEVHYLSTLSGSEVHRYFLRQYGTVVGPSGQFGQVGYIVWFRLALLAFGPPLVGYLLLFGVASWIFRGFKVADRKTAPVLDPKRRLS